MILILAEWIKYATYAEHKSEVPILCCSGDKVKIPKITEPKLVFKELISCSHPFSKHFLNHSRQYNTLFQMASFSAKKIVRETLYPL